MDGIGAELAFDRIGDGVQSAVTITRSLREQIELLRFTGELTYPNADQSHGLKSCRGPGVKQIARFGANQIRAIGRLVKRRRSRDGLEIAESNLHRDRSPSQITLAQAHGHFLSLTS